ncbi:hypothetical protein ABZ553_20480 [Streptomyces sparsogenes]|uniref:hypothetical protein n=1 Tax=Streptomyces sparsogenes TaxID=67365 RepID=UPI0033F63928
MTNHTPEQDPDTRPGSVDTRSEEDRLRLLETQVQTLADAVRALAQGLENIPTQDSALAAQAAGRGARLAHELLLSQGL